MNDETWKALEAEAESEDRRCSGCQRLLRRYEWDLCDPCLEADERTFGGDAA